MELRFETCIEVRRLLCAFQILSGSRIPDGMLKYPELFGDTFVALSGVLAYIERKQGGFAAAFRDVIAGNVATELAQPLDKLSAMIDDPELIERAQRVITTSLSDHGDAVASAIKETFGFSMPRSTTIVIGSWSGNNNSGHMIDVADDDVLITFSVTPTLQNDRMLGILVHELLHGLIQSSGIFVRSKKASMVEELLLEYSVPYGFLAERIGMAAKMNLQQAYENSIWRNYPEDLSKQVRKVIEEYIAKGDSSMIWEGVGQVFPDCVNDEAIISLV